MTYFPVRPTPLLKAFKRYPLNGNRIFCFKLCEPADDLIGGMACFFIMTAQRIQQTL